ncbi:hypothetical protein L4C33_04175 [Vibrio makurazakiensis]|uniref:hypothetical protein n=1 Tax=Vibrio makurazakiensis TaxID=2910250 RepID=UPI003D0B2F6B
MTINEFKHSDIYQCLAVAGELSLSIGKFAFSVSKVIVKSIYWVIVKAYQYVAK